LEEVDSMDARLIAAVLLGVVLVGTVAAGWLAIDKMKAEADNPNIKSVSDGHVTSYYYELPANETPAHAVSEMEKFKSAND
jgi:hypothetical protein